MEEKLLNFNLVDEDIIFAPFTESQVLAYKKGIFTDIKEISLF